MSSTDKPLILATAYPADGHAGPILRAASHLTTRGYDVWLATGEQYKEQALSSGIERFFALPNILVLFPDIIEGIAHMPPGVQQLDYAFTNLFVRESWRYADVVRHALETAREEKGRVRKIVVMQDMAAGGVFPFKYGAPLPKGFEDGFPPVLSLNVSVLFGTSMDAPPISYKVDPADHSSEELLKMHAELGAATKGSKVMMNRVLADMGCTGRVEGSLMDAWLDMADLTLQLCSPSLEYTRRDLKSNIRFVGGLPMLLHKSGKAPEWLHGFVNGTDRRKLVFVTQGTADVNYADLMIPTLQGLSGREDLFVVGVLGIKGGRLDEEVEAGLAGNIKVLDYFPYSEVLPHADVFVTNGGFGGFMQGVMNGIPMVIGGEFSDKGDVAIRMEKAGLGVNLKTGTPAKDDVVAAIERVLSNPGYKKRAFEIKKENEEMDAIGGIEKAVLELAAR